MKNLFFILFIFIISCSSQISDNQNVVINGQLSNSKNDTLYFSKLHFDKISDTDTIYVDANGKFHIEFLPDQCYFYILVHKGYNYTRLLIDKGEKIEFKADIRNIPASYSIEGSKGSSLLKTIESKVAKVSLLADSLNGVVKIKKNEPEFDKLFPVLDSIFKKSFQALKKDFIKIINENISSLASVVAINQSVSGMSLFNQFDDYDLFCSVGDSVFAKYPNNTFAINLQNRVLEYKLKNKEINQINQTLKVGLMAPDIKTINKSGNIVQLSSLRGKVVLLKFWDSHCPTCKAQNFKLKEIYSKYKLKGFEIFSVSVDVERKEWLDYLSKNNFNWVHSWLNDQPKDVEKPIEKLYNIDKIPIAHLIGRDGKFLVIDLKGDSVETELMKVLK